MKREQRGCDAESESAFYEWAPDLKRCPKSILTTEVVMMVAWWEDWKAFGTLPFSTGSLDTEPAIVIDIFRVCETASAKIQQELSNG